MKIPETLYVLIREDRTYPAAFADKQQALDMLANCSEPCVLAEFVPKHPELMKKQEAATES